MATYSPKDVVTLLADDGIATDAKKVRAFVRTSGVALACGSGNRYAWDLETFVAVAERMRAHASGKGSQASAKSADEIKSAIAALADESDESDESAV